MGCANSYPALSATQNEALIVTSHLTIEAQRSFSHEDHPHFHNLNQADPFGKPFFIYTSLEDIYPAWWSLKGFSRNIHQIDHLTFINDTDLTVFENSSRNQLKPSFVDIRSLSLEPFQSEVSLNQPHSMMRDCFSRVQMMFDYFFVIRKRSRSQCEQQLFALVSTLGDSSFSRITIDWQQALCYKRSYFLGGDHRRHRTSGCLSTRLDF